MGMTNIGVAWGFPLMKLLHKAEPPPGRTGSEFGAVTFIRRSVGLLWPRLRAALGDEGLAESCASADTVADAVLLERLLATAD